MNEIMYAATMNQYGVLNVYVSVEAADADSFKLEVERNNMQLVSAISYSTLNFPSERKDVPWNALMVAARRNRIDPRGLRLVGCFHPCHTQFA